MRQTNEGVDITHPMLLGVSPIIDASLIRASVATITSISPVAIQERVLAHVVGQGYSRSLRFTVSRPGGQRQTSGRS